MGTEEWMKKHSHCAVSLSSGILRRHLDVRDLQTLRVPRETHCKNRHNKYLIVENRKNSELLLPALDILKIPRLIVDSSAGRSDVQPRKLGVRWPPPFPMAFILCHLAPQTPGRGSYSMLDNLPIRLAAMQN